MHIVYFIGGPWDLTKRAYMRHPLDPIQVHELVEGASEEFVVTKIHQYRLTPIPVYMGDEQYSVGVYAPD